MERTRANKGQAMGIPLHIQWFDEGEQAGIEPSRLLPTFLQYQQHDEHSLDVLIGDAVFTMVWQPLANSPELIHGVSFPDADDVPEFWDAIWRILRRGNALAFIDRSPLVAASFEAGEHAPIHLVRRNGVPHPVASPDELRQYLLPALEAAVEDEFVQAETEIDRRSQRRHGPGALSSIGVLLLILTLKFAGQIAKHFGKPANNNNNGPAVPVEPQLQGFQLVELVRTQHLANYREMQRKHGLTEDELDDILKKLWLKAHPGEPPLWEQGHADWRLAADWNEPEVWIAIRELAKAKGAAEAESP